ncbi:MAG: SPOR domain-containing protein [Ignavibacterium sp.]|nr:MAG: SPOR domain-containing protein [Ignavibacterium sp.]
MTKNELVKLISKKAKVPDNLARELFDIFLIRIADKITVGQTAYLEKIGYFHLRKGKIRKPEKGLDEKTLEAHDFVVLSQSPDLNIKSSGNLVLIVPEIELQNRDEVDSHFRLSAEKPGMQNIKDRGTVFRLNQLSYDKRNELKEKVDSIISDAKTEKSISSKHGVLLVEMKKFSKEQSELNIDDIPVEKESLELSSDKIDSPEKSMSTEEQTGKDISEEIDIADETNLNAEARDWETVSEPIMEKKIELDKNVYENAGDAKLEENEDSNKLSDGLNKPILGATEDLENKGKKSSESGDANINRKFKRIKLKGQSFDNKKPIEKSESKKIPLRDIDINQDKEKIKEKDEINETEKIKEKEKVEEKEQIRESKELEGFEIEKYQKVTDGENQMHSEKFKEPSKVKETLATMSELEEDETAYDTEIDETYRGSGDRGLGMVFLTLFAAIIVVGGALYYFLIHKDSGSNELTEIAQFDNAVNSTYVDRNYDVPVSFPYSASESKIELHGLSSELLAAQIPVEQSGIEKSTTKVISDKEQAPPITTEKVTPPPVKKETTTAPQKVTTDIVKSVQREQVSQNVFKYNNTYAVQVAAFGTKKGAEDGAAKFIKSGYSAFIEEAVVKGKSWYRLRVGGFKTLEEAKQFQKANK